MPMLSLTCFKSSISQIISVTRHMTGILSGSSLLKIGTVIKPGQGIMHAQIAQLFLDLLRSMA
jgi:hypothetical protein